MHPPLHRTRLIDRLRQRLDRHSHPRLQMCVLVAITGGVGFLASSLLVLAGMHTMWSRYLLALAIAYLCFIGLLWLWLRTRADDYAHADLIPTPNLDLTPQSATPPTFSGKGGTFDGGGASGDVAFAEHTTAIAPDGHDNLLADGISAASEADELAFPLMAVLFAGGLLLSAFLLIHAAPVLFAELLVDGVLATSLYRRLRGLDTRHWLETAIRRTATPFAGAAALLVATGWLAQWLSPEAITLSQALFGH